MALTKDESAAAKRFKVVREEFDALYKKYPWMARWFSMWDKCNDPSKPGYEKFGGLGTRFALSMDEMKSLWERDRGPELDSPLVGRHLMNADFTFANCRFMGRKEYMKNYWKNRKAEKERGTK